MKSSAMAVWDRVTRFREELSPTAARALLKLQFSCDDQERLKALAGKASQGALSAEEEREAQAYEQLGCLLDVLHSQARRVLKQRRRAS